MFLLIWLSIQSHRYLPVMRHKCENINLNSTQTGSISQRNKIQIKTLTIHNITPVKEKEK